MPLYEYEASDGTRLELIRPMDDADKPVADPEGRGRAFHRVVSAFAARGGEAAVGAPAQGGCCPCGKQPGRCSNN